MCPTRTLIHIDRGVAADIAGVNSQLGYVVYIYRQLIYCFYQSSIFIKDELCSTNNSGGDVAFLATTYANFFLNGM